MRMKMVAISTIAVMIAAFLAAAPVAAEETAPSTVNAAQELDIAPLPPTLSDAQMRALSGGDGVVVLNQAPTATEKKSQSIGEHPIQAMIPTAGSKCFLNPGNMWRRASSGYQGIGSKPQLSRCSADVVATGMSSDVYRRDFWGWTKVAGPFNSFGGGNMESKLVTYYCNGSKQNDFQVVTTAWGTTRRGQTGVGRDSTGSYTWNCG